MLPTVISRSECKCVASFNCTVDELTRSSLGGGDYFR